MRKAESAERKAESGKRKAQSAERKAQSAERRAESAERRAQSGKRKAESGKRKAQSGKRRAQSAERKAQSAERRAQSAERILVSVYPIPYLFRLPPGAPALPGVVYRLNRYPKPQSRVLIPHAAFPDSAGLTYWSNHRGRVRRCLRVRVRCVGPALSQARRPTGRTSRGSR